MRDFSVFGAFFDSHTDNMPASFEGLPWMDFIELLRVPHVRPSKWGTSAGQNRFKDSPGFNLARFVQGGRRRNQDVIALSGFVIDFDEDFNINDVFARLDGVAYVAHTTYSHWLDKNKEHSARDRWRVIIPAAGPIDARDFGAQRGWLVNSLGANVHDKAAKALSNFYFLPACPPGLEHRYELCVGEGKPYVLRPLARIANSKINPNTVSAATSGLIGEKIDWPWVLTKASTHRNLELRRAFRAVERGQSFAPHGSRDTILTRMCGALAAWALRSNPDELAGVFERSLIAMREENPSDPPPDLANAADKIARAQSGLIAQGEQQRQREKESVPPSMVPSSPEQFDAWEAHAQLHKFADGDELRQRLIVRHKTSLWIYNPPVCSWAGPFLETEALQFARVALDGIPGVALWKRKADGNWGRRGLVDLSDDYGWIPSRVIADLSIERSTIVGDTFVDVGAPRRALEPLEDKFVHGWLEALGGDQVEKVLDWMATFPNLSKPTAVLFIKGPKDIGKGMLAAGLTHLWQVDAPTKMRDVAGAFQAELRRCPFVWIDEGKWNKWVDATTLLREYVTEPSRNVNEKFLTSMPLRGYARYLHTANNFNLFANEGNALAIEDREAIVQRFLFVEPGGAAARILAALPADALEAFPERIARHILWLAETRAPRVVLGRKLLVEGDPHSDFAMRIITEDRKWGSWVSEWLVRYLSDPTGVERHNAHLVSRDGYRVLVNPEAVVNTFNEVLKHKQPPYLVEISDTLRSLSTGEPVPFPDGERVGFEILVKEVAHWATSKGFSSAGRILANASSPRGGAGNVVEGKFGGRQ